MGGESEGRETRGKAASECNTADKGRPERGEIRLDHKQTMLGQREV